MDGQKIAKDLLAWIWTFLNTIVPVKLPGDIELAVWVWVLITGIVTGLLVGPIVWIKKN